MINISNKSSNGVSVSSNVKTKKSMLDKRISLTNKQLVVAAIISAIIIELIRSM